MTPRTTFLVVDPATDNQIARVSDGGREEAVAAVDAAVGAAEAWAASTARCRSDILHSAFELMMTNCETLARLIAAENGKVMVDARAEVSFAVEFLRWYSEEAVRPDETFGMAPTGAVRTIVTHRPVGVAALVTPWNFPAAMVTRKVGPALAVGCTVVLKPAAETPLTALALASVLERAGVPDGWSTF